MTVKLKLPPGFYNNGTPYQSAGRYHSGDLIRWHNDVIKPIDGWQRRADLVSGVLMPSLWSGLNEAARSGITVAGETIGVDTYIGTNNKIYHISNSNVVEDVTPAGFTPQDEHASMSTGYGLFRYSYGTYGTRRPATLVEVKNVFSWGFAEWGFWPLAVARALPGLSVFVKKDTDVNFVAVTGSPTGVFDIVVTDERFAMTIGTTADYRVVQWSDQENYTIWTPAIDNQAGSIRLAGNGKLLCGVKLLNQVLIIGENDAFTARYVGPPYVYGFGRVGSQCGIVGPEAIAVTETFAAWIGTASFWIYDGTVQRLDCEVLDFFLEDANLSQRSKITSFTISNYAEIWWLYQSKTAPYDEADSYIVFNYDKKIWYTGRINRTIGFDSNPLAFPLMISPQGYLYDHEVPDGVLDGRAPYIITGPLETEDGKRLLGLSYVYPDEQFDGDVLMKFYMQDMPKMSTRISRVFPLKSPTSTHGIMARDIRMQLYGSGASVSWKLGDFRIEPLQMTTPRR